MLNIYITDLTEYNAGNLIGKWFDLMDEKERDEAQEYTQDILNAEHEYFITDYESDVIAVSEYKPVGQLIEEAEELADALDGLDDIQTAIVLHQIEDNHGNITAAKHPDELAYLTAKHHHTFKSAADALGQVLIENGYMEDFDESNEMAKYFDYEWYGKEARHYGWVTIKRTDDYIFYNPEW